MAIGNTTFSFSINKSKPEGILEQLQAALKARLGKDQVPLRYAIVSVTGSKAVVEVSYIDKRGLV
jgi:hypothetical protein